MAIRPMFRHGAYYAPGGHTDPYAYNWLLLILFVPYAFALRAYSRGGERPSVRAVVLSAAAVSLPLIFIPPQQSHDIYQYLFYGKMQVAYGASPYLSAPNMFHTDSWFPYVTWPGQTAVYGPLWCLTLAATVGVAGGSLAAALVITKFVVLALAALAAWGLMRMGSSEDVSRSDPAVTLLAFGLNPLVVMVVALGGHADAALAAAFVWAVVWDRRGRPFVSGCLLALASLVKLYAAIPLAVYLLVQARRGRAITVAKIAAATTVIAAVTYAPYWGGAATFKSLVEIGGLSSSGAAGTVEDWLRSGLGSLGVGGSAPWAAAIVRVLGVAILAGSALAVARSRRTLEEPWRAAVILTTVFLLVTPWYLPWYVLSLLALALAATDATVRDPLLTFTGTSMIQFPGAGGAIRTLLRYAPPALVARRRAQAQALVHGPPSTSGEPHATPTFGEPEWLVGIEAEAQGADRRRLYLISESGVTDLAGWLADPEHPESHLKGVLGAVLALESGRSPARVLDTQRQRHLAKMLELTPGAAPTVAHALLADHALLHLGADLRWIETVESKLEPLLEKKMAS